MRNMKKIFTKELEDVAHAVQKTFSEQMDQILCVGLESLRMQVQQEIRNIIKQTRYDNLKHFQEDVFNSIFSNKLSSSQLLKRVSQSMIKSTL